MKKKKLLKLNNKVELQPPMLQNLKKSENQPLLVQAVQLLQLADNKFIRSQQRSKQKGLCHPTETFSSL